MSERRPLALVVCGALTREVREIAARRGWDADLYPIPALDHLAPRKIVEDVERELASLDGRYEKVVVVYGDCGTFGALDRVLERFGAVRTEGPHCYEMLGGAELAAEAERRLSTFFLTDWLVRNWERAVVDGLGIGRFPFLRNTYFDHITEVLYLRQSREPSLEAKAREIADSLGVPLEIRDVGLGDLERRLVERVEEPAPS
ncbi:MAG: hypothetical protein KatS3mg014_0689 [Actinomycetota bacterium]|nr:MAG: hypothetical protein KatS3mg014_0689 [Actinomycetota bacterium]